MNTRNPIPVSVYPPAHAYGAMLAEEVCIISKCLEHGQSFTHEFHTAENLENIKAIVDYYRREAVYSPGSEGMTKVEVRP